MNEAILPSPAKLDPETLAIRTRPPRAIRFKRGMIIAIAAFGSVSLIAVTWMALKPRLFERAQTQEELSLPNSRSGGEALSGAPATYGDVPKLGPPLPGDLGMSILEHQQAMASAINPADQQLEQAQAAERERQLAELKAARESGVLVQGREGNSVAEAVPASPPPSSSGEITAPQKAALDPERDPNAQSHKAEFVAASDPHGDINPYEVTRAPSPYTLSAGSVISASLITGIRSDVPGLVAAQVTENIYDSATGRILLIPQGSRLIGNYDSVVAFGQKRALVVWQRIIMPDGSSLTIDNVPASDPSGYSGLSDRVDFHTWQLLKGVVLSTLLGVSSELGLSGQSDLLEAMRISTQDNESRTSDQITKRNLDVQPTITIRPGAPVRLVVRKDLVLAPWRDAVR